MRTIRGLNCYVSRPPARHNIRRNHDVIRIRRELDRHDIAGRSDGHRQAAACKPGDDLIFRKHRGPVEHLRKLHIPLRLIKHEPHNPHLH